MGVLIRRGWNHGRSDSKDNHLSALSGERKENLPKVVPSACAIHLPKEAVRPALSLGIFRIRGDQVLGNVLQKTLAGAPRGIISESSSCHI